MDARCSFDVGDKLGLEGPGAAFEEVTFAISMQSPAPADQVRKLIAHAERGCHAEQTIRRPIPVKATARLNGDVLEL